MNYFYFNIIIIKNSNIKKIYIYIYTMWKITMNNVIL